MKSLKFTIHFLHCLSSPKMGPILMIPETKQKPENRRILTATQQVKTVKSSSSNPRLALLDLLVSGEGTSLMDAVPECEKSQQIWKEPTSMGISRMICPNPQNGNTVLICLGPRELENPTKTNINMSFGRDFARSLCGITIVCYLIAIFSYSPKSPTANRHHETFFCWQTIGRIG